MRLTGPEHFALMGLQRVRRGGITRIDGYYLDGGVQIPGCLLPDVFADLAHSELVTIAAPNRKTGWNGSP